MTRKILYVTGTRADYGLMRPVLSAIDKSPEFSLEIVATGMHLMPEFGSSIAEITADGFTLHRIDAVIGHDTRDAMSSYIGRVIVGLTDSVRKIRPDLILLLGDRAEMLAGAIVGTYIGVPVAHIHGGEITSTVDEPVRHAITRLAHIHLAATRKSAERIVRMGEDPSQVFVVGAPGLDSIIAGTYTRPDALYEKYGFDPASPIIVCVQHPVSGETGEAPAQMRETLEALVSLRYQTIVTYPNADAGGREMIRTIALYERYPFIRIYRNLPHDDYLGLLRIASVLVGNSSSGIIETPSFHVPAVNIGSRQAGRERACNVIDAGYDSTDIAAAIRTALFDESFRRQVSACTNPYGDGSATKNILRVLTGINYKEFNIQKRLQYE